MWAVNHTPYSLINIEEDNFEKLLLPSVSWYHHMVVCRIGLHLCLSIVEDISRPGEVKGVNQEMSYKHKWKKES